MRTPVICFADPAVAAALQRLTAARIAATLTSKTLDEACQLQRDADVAWLELDRVVSEIAERCEPHGLNDPVTLEWANAVLGEGVVYCPMGGNRDRNFLAYFPDGRPSIGYDLPDDVTKSELLAACYAFRIPLKEVT